MATRDLPSIYSSSSLSTDPHTTRFGASARRVRPAKAYSDYGFIAVLALIQRLEIDLLPITWQATLGQGGQAKINQALVNVQTSFAFKQFKRVDQSDLFWEIVQEMVVLQHPVVRNHPHIIQLVGICWDIPRNDQVWPILVFKKSQLGDLYRFARSAKGRDLILEDKLKACVEVGIALRDMHQNGIIHGDVKPQNVLIFEERVGTYVVKVADFGFSTHFHSEQEHLIQMPKSGLWTIPEHHSRHFTLQSAKAIDVYSFSMLCLWLLFDKEHAEIMLDPSEAKQDSQILSFEEEAQSKKRDDSLLEWAIQLVADDGSISAEMKNKLATFFQYNLNPVPETRMTDWDRVLGCLTPPSCAYDASIASGHDNSNREISDTKTFNGISPPKVESFQLISSILLFFQADFQLRSFITKQLEHIAAMLGTKTSYKHVSTADALEQRDLCYRIRFGTQDKNKQKERVLMDFSPSDAVERKVQQVIEIRPYEYRKTEFQKAFEGGFITKHLPKSYEQKEILEDALDFCKREVVDMEEVFGGKHILSIYVRDNLQMILKSQGRWKEAEELAVRNLVVIEEIEGKDHAGTLSSVLNLALVLQYQGKYKTAEEMIQRVLKGREKALGTDHPETLNCVSDLASVLQDQGKYKTAEEITQRALKGREKALGIDHPYTLASVSLLALVLQCQGKYKTAEEMNRRVLKWSEKALGTDHRVTLISVSNLAFILQDQGKYKAAEKMARRALKGEEKALGTDHPDTLASVSLLASVLQCQGKYKTAEKMSRRALKGSEKALGTNYPDTLISVLNLALVLQGQRKYKAAEEMNQRALKGREKALGTDHPQTLTSVNNLALVLQNQGKYKAAEKMNRRALKGSEKALGTNHPDTLISVSNLALVLQNQGKYKAAEKMSRRALKGSEKALGTNHPDTLISVLNLALVLQGQRKYKAAEEMYRRVLKGREKALGTDHPITLNCVSDLASVLQGQRKYKAAEEMNRRALKGREKALGTDHPETLASIGDLASILLDQERYKEALSLYQRASSGYHGALGPDHPETLACLDTYAHLKRFLDGKAPNGGNHESTDTHPDITIFSSSTDLSPSRAGSASKNR